MAEASLLPEEFVGMVSYLSESVCDLLGEASNGSISKAGRHHPSHECFMADLPKGHIDDVRRPCKPFWGLCF